MKNYTSKLRAFLFILSSVLCTSTYGAEYGRLIVPASSADPSSQAVVLAEGETLTVLQFSTYLHIAPPGSVEISVTVRRPPFNLELFYDPTDYENTEKMITFKSSSLAGIYETNEAMIYDHRWTTRVFSLTSSDLSRTYVGPCKIRITKTVSDQDCYLAYKIIRKPSPSVSTEE